jgi:hypothetical protein
MYKTGKATSMAAIWIKSLRWCVTPNHCTAPDALANGGVS